jgi:hypothetical protein
MARSALPPVVPPTHRGELALRDAARRAAADFKVVQSLMTGQPGPPGALAGPAEEDLVAEADTQRRGGSPSGASTSLGGAGSGQDAESSVVVPPPPSGPERSSPSGRPVPGVGSLPS